MMQVTSHRDFSAFSTVATVFLYPHPAGGHGSYIVYISSVIHVESTICHHNGSLSFFVVFFRSNASTASKNKTHSSF